MTGFAFSCVYVYMRGSLCACVCVRVCVCVCVCVCARTRTCMHACTHTCVWWWISDNCVVVLFMPSLFKRALAAVAKAGSCIDCTLIPGRSFLNHLNPTSCYSNHHWTDVLLFYLYSTNALMFHVIHEYKAVMYVSHYSYQPVTSFCSNYHSTAE